MRKLLIGVGAAATALVAASPAAAQYYPNPYGYGYGYGYDYGSYGYPANGMSSRIQGVCSGQRAYALENRLGHEGQEGEIDPYSVARIHQQIDRLENQGRQECAEGDWRSITSIADRYDRIGQWIETMAHGYQDWDR